MSHWFYLAEEGLEKRMEQVRIEEVLPQNQIFQRKYVSYVVDPSHGGKSGNVVGMKLHAVPKSAML